MRRGHLTYRMPRHEPRHDTERLQQPEQGHLDREQRRLSTTRRVQRPDVPTPHHLTQRRIELGQHPVQGPREHREPAVQLPPHPEPLRTLPREHHSKPTLGSHTPRHLDHTIRTIRRGQQHRPMIEHRPARHQREPNIQRQPPIRERPDPLHLRIERRTAHGRHRPRHHRRPDLRLPTNLHHRPGTLLQDHMRVRTTDPERRHSHPARMVRLRPRHVLRQQLDRTGRPVHVGRRLVHVQRPRQHPMPHRHDRLDQSGGACRRLPVAEVRLHRAQVQRVLPVLPVRRQQRLRLDRIAERGAGAVRLHRIDLRRIQPGAGQRLADHPLLRGAVRRGQTIRGTVLVHRRGPHHREDVVSVAHRIGHPFHYQRRHPLGPAGAVRGLGERLAAAVRRQAADPGESREGHRGGHDHHRPHEGQRAFPGTQGLRGQVQRHQRRRARRVHRDRRAFQPEDVGQPT